MITNASEKSEILKALRKQVAALEADLTPTGLADSRLKIEWRAARSADRTAATFETWLAERVTQVAVGWVLGTVFVRFCEDNGLIEYPFIAGPAIGGATSRLQLAQDLQQDFFAKSPELTDRDWLVAAFDALSVSPVAAALFDRRHNPMWTISPSHDAAKALVSFWRQTGPDGEVVYDFTDETWNTRFLGDLYQDLSEAARKTYALLQTPEFVEEFILKYTLDPAIEEFGLTPAPPAGHEDLPAGLRVIDPACGSGHFLLGAFRRLLAAWEKERPSADRWDLVSEALLSVHGVDKNPFAVAIARFRLMLAAMREGGVMSLSEAVDFTLNIACGDSLLHGKDAPGSQMMFNFDGEQSMHTYRTEDVDDFIKSVHILEPDTYHVVVANPPYITPKDEKERENYRRAYKRSCSGKYALSVPFVERIFTLAIPEVGYTGQITSNSFMKREFGKKLIEDFCIEADFTHVIDASGAYIPGHGTPTVILIGHHRYGGFSATTRAVLGVRGEPSEPEDPSKGLVWTAIVDQVDRPGSESEWVSAVNIPRDHFSVHPWSLGGGGASDVAKTLSKHASSSMESRVSRVGVFGMTNAGDIMIAPLDAWRRRISDTRWIRRLVVGDELRNWETNEGAYSYFPYSDERQLQDITASPEYLGWLWPCRTTLGNRATFTQGTYFADGRPWYEWHQIARSPGSHSWAITYAEVATHNHFVLDRDGKVFNQTAPIIKLRGGATEDDHLALLGVLNSSTACFWLKQVSQKKGGAANSGGGSSDQPWSWSYQFNGAKVEAFPLSAALPLEFGRELDSLAQQLFAVEPSAVCTSRVPTHASLNAAHTEHESVRARMIALQEELDWDVYHRYGLITDDEAAVLVAEAGSVPNVKLGERAFEIVLARRVEKGEAETQWFARHRSTPITEVPIEWPEAYRQVVERRIAVIERNRNIGLIERPECKRRWQSEPWEKKEAEALTTWLLDRCEDKSLWYDAADQPVPMTVNRLADRLRTDPDVVSVAALLAGRDKDLADVLRDIISEEHVPFLAQYRYKPSGLDKRRQWERTWDQQREEDATGKRLDIPVPPKYAGADFQKQSYWRHRGKLDVPNERFISYPDASPDSDSGSLLIGWAGWDHREQAAALISLIEDRSQTDGWDTPKLMGLLAGLLEILPWVRQWHNDLDPAYGTSPADAYDTYLTAQRESRNITEESLRTLQPTRPTRGRRK